MLKFLQICALVLIGVILLEIVLWGYLTDNTPLLRPMLVVLAAYLGLLLLLVFGDRERGLRKVLVMLWQWLLGSRLRAGVVSLLLLVVAVALASANWQNWFVSVHGVILHEGKQVEETFEVTPVPEGLFPRVTSSGSVFEIRLPWYELVLPREISLSAESANYRTEGPQKQTLAKRSQIDLHVIAKERTYRGHVMYNQQVVNEELRVTLDMVGETLRPLTFPNGQLEFVLPNTGYSVRIAVRSKTYKTAERVTIAPEKAGDFEVPVVLRKQFLVEVDRSDNPDFEKNEITVLGHDVLREDTEPQDEETDDKGVARFEANAPSVWQLQILLAHTYTSPIFDIDRLPYRRKADLASGDWEISPPVANIAAAALRLKQVRLKRPSNLEMIRLTRAAVSTPDPPPKADWVRWAPKTDKVLVREGYIASYNPKLKIPNWVAYKVQDKGNVFDARAGRIRPDPEVSPELSALPGDYPGSGYDRGHLVSVRDMAFISARAVAEANYLSVICPQTPVLNRYAWRELEDHARHFAKEGICIVAGPAFVPDKPHGETVKLVTIGRSNVAVPTHFFRILVRDAHPGRPVEGFLVPNSQEREEDLSQYLVPVEHIEKVTGLSFFHGLPERFTSRLKKHQPAKLWHPNE